jgi:uncharacterized protein
VVRSHTRKWLQVACEINALYLLCSNSSLRDISLITHADELDAAALLPHYTQRRMSDMISVCPKCDVGLFIINFKSVEVDYCERCHGVWLDAGELERLMEIAGAHPSDPLERFRSHVVNEPRTGKHLCPRCDRPLEELVIDESTDRTLTLDRCLRGHGLWFDVDELQDLLALYPPDSGASKTIQHLNDLFGRKSKA